MTDSVVVPRIYQSFRAPSESASRDVYTTNRSISGGGGEVEYRGRISRDRETVSVLVPRNEKNRIVSDDS